MLLEEPRAAVVEYANRMLADGLTVATSGNVSVRADDLICITPSGVDYASLTPGAISVVTLEGDRVEGPHAPSSEVPMHTAVYAATDAGAVVHTHSMYATTVSTVRDDLPAVHYMVALLGGPVRVAPYATYGTRELAEASVDAMRGRTGVLLANHGATTYGTTLAQAYARSQYLEWVCELYCRARALGEPHILPDEEIERVRVLLAGRGDEAPGPGAAPGRGGGP